MKEERDVKHSAVDTLRHDVGCDRHLVRAVRTRSAWPVPAAQRPYDEAFAKAIDEYQYEGRYRGVFPVKVNQQSHLVEDVVRFGKRFDYGLEALEIEADILDGGELVETLNRPLHKIDVPPWAQPASE